MSIPLIVFAKAPIAGQVKTRLQSHCSAQQAAEIAKLLLDECLSKVTAVWPGAIFLSVANDQQHPFILKMVDVYEVRLVQQSSGDLGEKMHSSFEEHGYPAAILGSDAPHISKAALLRSYEVLRSNANVIGPSEDGGYYLIGLSNPSGCLFEGMGWGQSTVLNSTLSMAENNSIVLEQLESLNDIDTWPDLMAAIDQLPTIKNYLVEQLLISHRDA